MRTRKMFFGPDPLLAFALGLPYDSHRGSQSILNISRPKLAYLVHVSRTVCPDFARFGSTFVTYRHAYCATIVDVGVVGLGTCRVLHGQAAEYKPWPLLICILSSAIVLNFQTNSDSTTVVA